MSEVYDQPVRASRIEALSLGMVLRYSVWANKSLQGDFSPEVMGLVDSNPETRWTVEAQIGDTTEVELVQDHHREILVGHRAIFNVFNLGSTHSLQESQAVILPRQAVDRLTAKQLGKYPIQEGYATRLHDFRVDGEPMNGRLAIPRRNVRPRSLRVISPGFSN